MSTFDDEFEWLFGRAYRAATRLVGSGDAEDVAAEALTRAYVSWWRLRDASHAEAWVLRTTTNLSIDVLRRRKRSGFVPPNDGGVDNDVELRAVLVPLLLGLPRRQREVVALRHLVDLSEQEVASVLGISPGAVKQHLHRGLASVRGRFPHDPMLLEAMT